MTGLTAGSAARHIYSFSDFDSLQSPDAFSTVLSAWDHYVVATINMSAYQRAPLIRGGTTEGVVLMRDYLGEGENITASGITLDVTSTTAFESGVALNVPFPNGPGNSLMLHPTWLQQSNGHVRGRLRGLLSVLHTHTLGDLATVSDVPGLAGRKVLLVAATGRAGNVGSFAFDITGPWGSP